MTEAEYNNLLDLIYEAALRPAAWAPVMETMADHIAGTSAWLSRLDLADGAADGGDAGVLTRVDPCMPPLYVEHYGALNPLHLVSDVGAYVREWAPKIITDEDWMPKADLVRTEFYNGFLKPQDIHSTMMIRLALHGRSVCVLNINRPERRGQFQAAELETAARLQPHLIRAYRLSEQAADLRLAADGFAEGLDLSPNAIFLVTAGGVVRHANRAAEALLARGPLRVAEGRLRLDRHPDSGRLDALIGAATARDSAARAAGELAVRRGEGLPLSVMVTPVAAAVGSPFPQPRSALVVVADLEAGSAPSERRLRALFGLTPAEARLAVALSRGCSLMEAAQAEGISYFTVRNRLTLICDKTGARGQVGLARLLARVGGAPEGPPAMLAAE